MCYIIYTSTDKNRLEVQHNDVVHTRINIYQTYARVRVSRRDHAKSKTRVCVRGLLCSRQEQCRRVVPNLPIVRHEN